MNAPDRWAQLKDAFSTLSELPPMEQRMRLDALTARDPELGKRVQELLEADARADSVLHQFDLAPDWSNSAPDDSDAAVSERSADNALTSSDPFGYSGQVVSQYRVREVLGIGGMGVVYRGEDLRLGRSIALKFLLPQYAVDSVAKERFLQEARAASALDHPNVCTVYGVGETERGHLFLAMAFYEGETLKTRLGRSTMRIPDAVAVMRQILQALTAAHAAGIVHRDLKPGNVMLVPDGTVKILDFGLAKVSDLSLTGPGLRPGTVAYMSPEQVEGTPVDHRSDLWSLGVVMYEMLTGQRPFGGGHDLSTVYAILHDEPDPPSRVRPDVPPSYDGIVDRLLRKDRDERYASAAEVIAELDATSSGGVVAAIREAPPASPTSGPVERPRRARRRRLWLGVGVGTAVVLASLLLLLRSQRPTAATPAASDPASLDAKRVAVGVFENQTGDSTLSSLGTMASDWVVRGLARTGVVRVLDAATLYTQPSAGTGAREGALELARHNGAGLAVGGRFYVQHDSLIFTASVFDVASGRVLNTFEPIGARRDQPLPAIEELEQRVAAALVAAFDPRASAYVRGIGERPPTYDAYRELIEAHQKYWRGRTAEGIAGFRRAARLDSSFLGAAMWLATTSATVDDCRTVDSLATLIERRAEALSAGDAARIRGMRARCARDWDAGVEAQRDVSAAEPGSTLARWAMVANVRRANRPAEAVTVAEAVDPQRDLGWMSDAGKVMYWRELAWAHHMLGDTAGQRRAVDGLRRMAPGRLATAYFASLLEVSAGRPAAAVRAVDDVEALPADPPLVLGEIAGSTPPDHVGTPAWVLYQVGTELMSVGDSAGGAALAGRAVRWLQAQSAETRGRAESRYLAVLALELEGQVDSAASLVRQLVRDDPENVQVRGRAGVLAARRGERAEAMAIDSWLARRPMKEPPGGPQLERARIAAALGDRDRAMQLLETLPFRSHPVDVVFFHSDPALASLRGQDRWARFLKPKG